MSINKAFTIATATFIVFSLSSSLSFAQSATPSAEVVTQTLKDRVQKVLQDEGGKVQGASVAQSSSFGLIGTLQKVVGSTLQIVTVTGPTRVVELDKTAVILRQGKQIKTEEIELNSPVIATGVFDQDRTYHVRRLTTLTESYQQSKRVTIYGTLQSLTTKAFTISVIAGVPDSQIVLPYTTKTAYYDLLDTKIEKKYVKAMQNIVAVIPEVLTATSSASRIYVMTPISTVSATPIQ